MATRPTREATVHAFPTTDDGERASVRRCAQCSSVMDSWCHMPDDRDLCPVDALGWMRGRRDQQLRVWPMLWRLRDAIRTAEDSAVAAEVVNKENLLIARLGQGLAPEVRHATVLPDADGVLSYWLWWPGGGSNFSATQIRPLGDSTTDPVDAAVAVAVQIVMGRDPTQ